MSLLDGTATNTAPEQLTLKRELGLFSAVSLIISVMIGAGIFVSPSSALVRAGSVGEALIVWAVCGAISLLGALSFAELGTVVPQSGAEYSFFRATYSPLHGFWGPLPGFVFIWVVVLILRPAEAAIIILVFSEYVYQPLAPAACAQHSQLVKKIIALLALGITTYVNTKSVKLFVKMQNIFSSFKIVICVVVIGGGIYNLSQGNMEHLSKGFEGSKTGVKDIILSIYSGLWAYDGWTSVIAVSEEIIKPNKNIPRSILIAVPLVTVLFVSMNIAYMSVLTVEEMTTVPAVAVAFGERILGPLRFVIPAGVALATFSCSMASQFGVARLTFAAGREGHMPECLCYIHVHRYTPAPAVTLQGVLTLVFILAGDIVTLIEFASFLIWTFYGLAFLALIILRKTRPNVSRPYKVPLAIPVFLVVLSTVLATVPIFLDPSPGHLGAVGFIILGLLVYYPLVYLGVRPPGLDKLNFLVQVLMQVAPPAKAAEL
ncbi:b(0,+)-type amino acid transporter 1-like [Macrosteles quadrilineatus]|uniref:b(0,+)-type amino acid transporter 1-like n=1 Tax=Macrosteles quadrilineatus TaxID=74068 RepID=UPI0023E2A80A|nr:b(0,+)-type amino acid transporter 1-like [Macrosteles quadrilineatus]